MLRSFILIAFRNLRKNPGFSVINILGLAIGMASALIMLLWIENEVSYDQFHDKKDRIYEAWNRFAFSGDLNCWNTTPKILAPTLEKDFPEVERSIRVNWPQEFLFTVGDKRLYASGNYVENGFLDVFTFPLEKGHPKTALDDINNVVLSKSLARKLFGDEDPMGKQVKVGTKDYFVVSGVLAEMPKNTRFQFEYLLNWKFMEAQEGGPENQWGNNSTRTYVLLKPGANFDNVQAKMKVLKPKYDSSEPSWEMFLYPMSRWRLYSSFTNGVEDGGLITYIYMFGIIAGFVLLIACINFMNLSTARSEKRAKEVGIRKVVGARKAGLIGQFLLESILLAGMAGFLAVALVYINLPGFNKLAQAEIGIPFQEPLFWVFSLLFILFTGLLAGSYPAFFLSRFEPVRVLKGTFRSVSAAINPRKVLVVFQFACAIVLIVGTLIVRKQIDFAQERNLGYNKNNLVFVYFDGLVGKNFEMIKRELYDQGVATSITKTSSPITQCWSDGWGMEWEGKDPNDKTDIDRLSCDEKLKETFGMQFVAGRDFDPKTYATDSSGMVINESSLKLMKFKNPIGQIIKDNGRDWHVIGVIKDFIMRSPYSPHKPLIIAGPASGWYNVSHIRLNPAHPMRENLGRLETIFRKYNPEFPFSYKFVDQEYASKFEDESRIGTMAGVFAGLTIFISCMGLFGLATYMAENRTKEIGIRKVLGASVSGLVGMLSKEFLILVGISLLIASPLAWWTMHSWLEDYAYRVEIQWWFFALAGLLAMFIALLTVSFQAIKAAMANPVRSLRAE
jgi:predicted permease